MHRAKRIAPRECEWKHGDSGHSAGEKTFVQPSQTRIDLTPAGLLMEGRYTQNPRAWARCVIDSITMSAMYAQPLF